MSVLYIKSLGTELQECQKENMLLRKIIKKQNIMIDHIADLMSKGCSLVGTKEQIIEEMEREAMEEGEKIIAILNQNEKKNNNEDEILTQEKLKESYRQLKKLGVICGENK